MDDDAVGRSRVPHPEIDYLEMRELMNAIRETRPTPLDVYHSAGMGAIVRLSEESITKGAAPVTVPDFRREQWKTRNDSCALPG